MNLQYSKSKIIGLTSLFLFGSFVLFAQFDPNSISGLNVWLKASNGVSDIGGFVESWTDQSPNSHSFLPPVVGDKPQIISTSSLNSKPYVLFDGTDRLLSSSNFSFNNCSVFIVSSQSSSDPNYSRLIDHSYNLGFWYGREVGNKFGGGFIEGNAPYGNFVNINDDIPSLLTSIRNGATVSSYLNSVSFPTQNRTTFSSTTTSNKIALGGTIDGLAYGRKKIYEIIIYNRVLTPSEINIVESYIYNEYASSISLGPDLVLNDLCSVNLVASSGFNAYLWSTGETTSSINVNESGQYWVRSTDVFGRYSYDTIQLTYPAFPPPTNTGICIGNTNTWNADMGPGFTYLWSTGETTPSIDISTPGIYNVTVFDSFGCSKNSGDFTFTTDDYENTAYLGPDADLCSGNELTLQVGAAETVEYYWNGDLTSTQEASYLVTSSGEYTLESVNVNGCVAQDTIQVTIIGTAPEANFSIINFCLGDAIQFTDQTIAAGSDPIVTWNWDFGDLTLSTLENPSHVYSSAGTYQVELFVESAGGCGDQITLPVTIFEKPTAEFSFTQNCSAETTLFSDLSSLGGAPINAWLWNFGNPALGLENVSSQQNPGRIYGAAGTYDVYLQVTDNNGCSDDTLVQINVFQSPTASFTASDHCAGDNIIFTNTSAIPNPNVIVNYLWDFGDNTYSPMTLPNKTYTNSGTHSINLTVTADNGCSAGAYVDVFTHALPIPLIGVGPACAGTYTTFTDASIVSTGAVAGSEWVFDLTDLRSGNPVQYIFTTPGSHNISLNSISDFGCEHDTMVIINVNPALQADFDAFPSLIIAGESVVFNNTSVGQTNNSWDLGDGTNTSVVSPQHTYSSSLVDSDVPVTLVVNNTIGCSDTLIQTFTITEARFDLEVRNIFLSEQNGFLVVGVELKNVGSSLIEYADVVLRLSNGTQVMDRYEEILQSGESVIMIFDALPSAFISDQDENEDFICAEGFPYSSLNLPDADLSNNTFCKNREGEDPVLIGPDPNPAETTFSFSVLITKDAKITVDLTDASGRMVKNYFNGKELTKGLYTLETNVSTLGAGVYWLRMLTEESSVVKKILITRD